jgi:hypothetical protein
MSFFHFTESEDATSPSNLLPMSEIEDNQEESTSNDGLRNFTKTEDATSSRQLRMKEIEGSQEQSISNDTCTSRSSDSPLVTKYSCISLVEVFISTVFNYLLNWSDERIPMEEMFWTIQSMNEIGPYQDNLLFPEKQFSDFQPSNVALQDNLNLHLPETQFGDDPYYFPETQFSDFRSSNALSTNQSSRPSNQDASSSTSVKEKIKK